MYSVEAESIVRNYEAAEGTFDEFIKNLQIKVISKTQTTIIFDLMNAPPSLANALRRILIAETPSVAIHNVSIRENDTIFPDEYIAHRLGLVPIAVNPNHLEYSTGSECHNNALNFKLTVRNDMPDTVCLYSDQIVFVPVDGQEHMDVEVKPGVLICKMAPGNIIDMDLTAEKGIGKTHAKWSPVSLCTYRLMPKIVIEKDFYGSDAEELQGCFSKGVISITGGKAEVSNPRLETMSREVFRHDKYKDFVKITREKGWFCFTVESISTDPLLLVKAAISTLAQKCTNLKQEITHASEH